MRFVIFVEGGLVEEVLCSERCEYLIIDRDVVDEEEARELIDTTGKKSIAAIGRYEEAAHPDAVEHYFIQADV